MTNRTAKDYPRNPEQAKWYSNKSGEAQNNFKVFKVATIVLAASVPVLLTFDFKHLAAISGGLVVVTEGVLSLYGWQRIWMIYRLASERLTVESARYTHNAKPYNIDDEAALTLYIERSEAIMSDERAAWAELREQTDPKPEQNT